MESARVTRFASRVRTLILTARKMEHVSIFVRKPPDGVRTTMPALKQRTAHLVRQESHKKTVGFHQTWKLAARAGKAAKSLVGSD